MKTDLFYNSMGLCGNFTGLRMFQISAMINLKIKFEGSANRPCAKHNEEQRESRRVCEWQSKLLTWKFPRKHVPRKKKMLITALFLSFRVFFFPDVSAATPISVFSLWSFRFVVFLCKSDCFDGKNEIWSVSTSSCRARDHNLAGVALITWQSFSPKTHDHFLSNFSNQFLLHLCEKKYMPMRVLKNRSTRNCE